MNKQRLFSIILGPHMTSKSHSLSEDGSYFVFKVLFDATKYEIRDAIEFIFAVNVHSIKTLRVKGKIKSFKGSSGRTKKWKKAYIRLKKGSNINISTSQ